MIRAITEVFATEVQPMAWNPTWEISTANVNYYQAKLYEFI